MLNPESLNLRRISTEWETVIYYGVIETREVWFATKSITGNSLISVIIKQNPGHSINCHLILIRFIWVHIVQRSRIRSRSI